MFLVLVLLPQRLRLQAITMSSLCFSFPREGLESPLVFLGKGSKETQRKGQVIHVDTARRGEKAGMAISDFYLLSLDNCVILRQSKC